MNYWIWIPRSIFLRLIHKLSIALAPLTKQSLIIYKSRHRACVTNSAIRPLEERDSVSTLIIGYLITLYGSGTCMRFGSAYYANQEIR
jgi:hypothetical protein